MVLGAQQADYFTTAGGMDEALERVAAEAMEEAAEEMANAAGDAAAEKLEQQADLLAGFMSNVQTNVFDAISAQSVGPQGFVENAQGVRMIVG